MKPSQGIEIVSNVDNSNDLLLCGIDGIDRANYDLSAAQYYGTISQDNSINNVFGLGEENKFFYLLASYKNNVIVKHENGIGYAYELDGKFYFKRSLPMTHGKQMGHNQLINSMNSKFICDQDAVNIIASYTPADYALAYHDKNSILCSTHQFIPRCVQVSPHSFLARINDNDISNVYFDSKEFADIIISAVERYKLNVNKFSVKQLQLNPASHSGAKKGTMIYDEDSDSIKFYNGTVWRTLRWAEDEKAE